MVKMLVRTEKQASSFMAVGCNPSFGNTPKFGIFVDAMICPTKLSGGDATWGDTAEW